MLSDNNRIIQFDALRVIATLAVVWLHTAAQRFYICYPSAEWDIRNFYDSIVRWAVPIFVMISGALFLNPDKKIGIKSLYTKYIFRVLIIFIFWSIIYGAYSGIGESGIVGMLGRMVQGPYHFWFLKMIIGLYICLPILREIVKDKKLEQYFILLSFITAFAIPMIFPLLGYYSDLAKEFAEKYYNAFGIKIALGHVGYFVLGNYLARNVISKKVRHTLYLLGILSFVAVCTLTRLASDYNGEPYLLLYENINLFTLFEALAIFIAVKELKIAPKYNALLINASKLSLGIYIIHPLVTSIFYDLWGIDSASLNPIYFIPLFTLIIFAISYLLSFVLIKIPVVKRFLI